jgi:hypothetical protein
VSGAAAELARVAGALGALAAELRETGERNFVELIEEMQQQASAPATDAAEASDRLRRLARRYDAMRAHPYGLDSVFFGYGTVAETKAATAHLDALRNAVSTALHAGRDEGR